MNRKDYPTKEAIEEAEKILSAYLPETPVWTNEQINRELDIDVHFKMECLMPDVLAFKIRGALYTLLTCDPDVLKRGVVTHSSGNHGKALAYAAKKLGIPAYIVVPENAPKVKREGIKAQGATLIDCSPTQRMRELTAERVVQETGATFIHPYNDYRVITGQATAGKEFIKQVSQLDQVMVPVGGGGLLSGTALSALYFSKSIKVIGTEPEEVNDAYRSLLTGMLQKNTTTNTIADALKLSLGDKTFPIIQQLVYSILQVSEEEIQEAMLELRERLGVTIEPSSAVPYAALKKYSKNFYGKKVGIILTGGNI